MRFEQLTDIFDLPVTVTLQYTDGSSTDVVVVVDERVVERSIPIAKPLRSVDVDRDELVMGKVER